MLCFTSHLTMFGEVTAKCVDSAKRERGGKRLGIKLGDSLRQNCAPSSSPCPPIPCRHAFHMVSGLSRVIGTSWSSTGHMIGCAFRFMLHILL